MIIYVIIAGAIFIAFALIYRLWLTIRKVPIKNPVIRLVSFEGDSKASALAKEDKEIYTPHYANVETLEFSSMNALRELVKEGTTDLFHLLVDVDSNAMIVDPQGKKYAFALLLKEMASEGVSFVFFAKGNPFGHYNAKKSDYPIGINITLCQDREGDKFLNWYKNIFTHMAQGARMTTAWKKFAAPVVANDNQIVPRVVSIVGAGEIVLIDKK